MPTKRNSRWIMNTTKRDSRWPQHWRSDRKETFAELEGAGWRILKRTEKLPGESWDYQWSRGSRTLEPIAPGARHALYEVVMGRPAPRRE
jgi:hypothetical protein